MTPSHTDRKPTYWCVLGTLLVLGLGYAALPFAPISAGWENGLLENAQVVLLAAAGVLALRHGLRSGSQGRQQQKSFWTAVAPLWFIMAARELSWGAAFLTPIAFDAITGPKFSSTQQIWYRPAVVPLIGVLLLWCLWRFGRARSLQICQTLRKARALPLIELTVFAACMLASAAAERNAQFNVPDFFQHLASSAPAQSFEELAELCAFAALACAQARVARFWRNARCGASN